MNPRFKAFAVLGPFFAALLLYLPALKFGFIHWDAPSPVSQIFMIRRLAWDSLSGMVSFFQPGSFSPVAWLAFALEYRCFGFSPAGYHFAGIFLHALNGALAVIFLMRLRQSAWVALLAGVFFAVHPLQVESVVWISSQKTLLLAVFSFLSLLGYADFLETGNRRGYVRSFFFYLLAAMSNATAVALPLVLIFLHYYFRDAFRKRAALTIPFFCVAFARGALIFLSCRPEGGIVPLNAEVLAGWALTPLWAIAVCAKEVFVPARLEIYASLKNMSWGNPGYLIPSLLSILALPVCLLAGKRHKILMAMTAWYVAWLLPAVLMHLWDSPIAARYLYLPILGPLALAAGAVSELSGRTRNVLIRTGVAAGVIFFVAVSCLSTTREMARWRDSKTLWAAEIERHPLNGRAYAEFGSVYFEEGNIEQAVKLLSKAVSLDPDEPVFSNNLAAAYRARKDYVKARELALRFLEKNPRDARLLIQLGMIESENNSAKSEDYFSQAIRADPENPLAWHAKGCFYLDKLEKPAEAYPFFLESVRIDPYQPDFLIAIAACSSRGGFYDQAISSLRLAVELEPKSVVAWYNLGQLLRLSGDEESARKALEEAFKADSVSGRGGGRADSYTIGFQRD